MINEVIRKIQEFGIVPVVVIDDVKDADLLAKALIDGGLPCAEVTFRTEAAKASIRIMTARHPDMLVGAGTVLTTAQVDDAISVGAKFVVSPGYNPKIAAHCKEKGILLIPGAVTPSEIEQVMDSGISVVKFFPAEAAGGLDMIKALSAPYLHLRFMPTGGIDMENIKDYLALEKVIACGGSWMVNRQLIKKGKFERISELTKEAVEAVKESRGN